MRSMPKTLNVSSQSVLLTSSGVVAYLSLTHMVSDAITHIFSALLPTLQYRFGLTEAMLALLVATLAFSSSVTQPIFGALADRFGHVRVGALGVILNATLLSLIGIVPTLYLLFGLLLIGGLGSAALHPAGASLARAAGGTKAEYAVSLFSAGGTLGIALGPVIVLILVANFELSFTPWLMLPAVALGLLMFFVILPQDQEASKFSNSEARIFDFQLLTGPIGLLALAGILSGVAFVTFTSAIPLWLVQTHGLKYDDPLIGWTLAVFTLSAALGGVGAGLLSRRVNQRHLVTGSLLLALFPLFALFAQEPGTLLFFLMVVLAGGLVHASLPLMIVSAQDLAPRAAATASGMLMGFAGGMAGILYIGIGYLQQLIGLAPAIRLSYLTLIPAAILAFYVLTKFDTSVDPAKQAPIVALSCLCSPSLSANISTCPCRAKNAKQNF